MTTFCPAIDSHIGLYHFSIMAQAAFKMDSFIPNPPPPTKAEVDAEIVRLALRKFEPQLREVVASMLHYERLAKEWSASVEKLSDKLREFSARELDVFIATFSGFVRALEGDFAPLFDRASRELEKSEGMPPEYRASVSELWRRTENACRAVLEQTREALKAGGSEKALRFPESFWHSLSDEDDKNDKSNQEAAQVYKFFADRQFGVDCKVGAEDVGNERFYFVIVPVSPEVEKPHRVFATHEDQIQTLIEAIRPDLLGRAYLRYVRSADAS